MFQRKKKKHYILILEERNYIKIKRSVSPQRGDTTLAQWSNRGRFPKILSGNEPLKLSQMTDKGMKVLKSLPMHQSCILECPILLYWLIICSEEVGKSYQKPTSITWMPTSQNNQGLVGCVIKYAKMGHSNALLKELYIFILFV